MKLEELRELIQLMRDNQIAEIDLEEEGKRVRVVAAQAPSAHLPMAVSTPVVLAPVPTLTDSTVSAHAAAASALPVKEEGVTVTSPIVGTFYSSPSPEAPPLRERGGRG